MEHRHDRVVNGAGELVRDNCDYVERAFEPNLIYALDKLGEQFGPLGVAIAAATRTEPETLNSTLVAAFTHQRELWDWLTCHRYYAEVGEGDPADGSRVWHVRDLDRRAGVVANISESEGSIDAEDSAHALADHLNRKVMLAKVAQAVADISGPRQERAT